MFMCNVYVCGGRLVCICITCMQFPQRPEEGIKYPQRRSYREFRSMWCGCWKLNLGSFGEQQLLLNDKSSLQSLICLSFILRLSVYILLIQFNCTTHFIGHLKKPNMLLLIACCLKLPPLTLEMGLAYL